MTRRNGRGDVVVAFTLAQLAGMALAVLLVVLLIARRRTV